MINKFSSQHQQLSEEQQIEIQNLDEDIFDEKVDSKSTIQYLQNRHFGNNYVFYFKDNEPYYTIGPHWPVSLVTIAMILGFGYLISNLFKTKELYYLSLICVLIDLILYFRVFLRNPGIISSNIVNRNFDYCQICYVKRHLDITHCTDCNICVEQLDHHCPWTGKCIAKNNLSQFYSWITFTFTYLTLIAAYICFTGINK